MMSDAVVLEIDVVDNASVALDATAEEMDKLDQKTAAAQERLASLNKELKKLTKEQERTTIAIRGGESVLERFGHASRKAAIDTASTAIATAGGGFVIKKYVTRLWQEAKDKADEAIKIGDRAAGTVDDVAGSVSGLNEKIGHLLGLKPGNQTKRTPSGPVPARLRGPSPLSALFNKLGGGAEDAIKGATAGATVGGFAGLPEDIKRLRRAAEASTESAGAVAGSVAGLQAGLNSATESIARLNTKLAENTGWLIKGTHAQESANAKLGLAAAGATKYRLILTKLQETIVGVTNKTFGWAGNVLGINAVLLQMGITVDSTRNKIATLGADTVRKFTAPIVAANKRVNTFIETMKTYNKTSVKFVLRAGLLYGGLTTYGQLARISARARANVELAKTLGLSAAAIVAQGKAYDTIGSSQKQFISDLQAVRAAQQAAAAGNEEFAITFRSLRISQEQLEDARPVDIYKKLKAGVDEGVVSLKQLADIVGTDAVAAFQRAHDQTEHLTDANIAAVARITSIWEGFFAFIGQSWDRAQLESLTVLGNLVIGYDKFDAELQEIIKYIPGFGDVDTFEKAFGYKLEDVRITGGEKRAQNQAAIASYGTRYQRAGGAVGARLPTDPSEPEARASLPDIIINISESSDDAGNRTRFVETAVQDGINAGRIRVNNAP